MSTREAPQKNAPGKSYKAQREVSSATTEVIAESTMKRQATNYGRNNRAGDAEKKKTYNTQRAFTVSTSPESVESGRYLTIVKISRNLTNNETHHNRNLQGRSKVCRKCILQLR